MVKALRSLGQNFLTSKDIAQFEASFGENKKVIEVGPGYGILTKELVLVAKKVFAIEKDTRLFEILKVNEALKDVTFLNLDILKVEKEKLKGYDILISNPPYYLSSKLMELLYDLNIEGVMILQKEFVEHMVAESGTSDYSRLSILAQLKFDVLVIKTVSRGSFLPQPGVDSLMVHMVPKKILLTENESKIIKFLTEHKKKTIRNAIIDSSSYLNIEKEELRKIFNDKIYNERVFNINPNEMLNISKEISKKLKEIS